MIIILSRVHDIWQPITPFVCHRGGAQPLGNFYHVLASIGTVFYCLRGMSRPPDRLSSVLYSFCCRLNGPARQSMGSRSTILAKYGKSFSKPDLTSFPHATSPRRTHQNSACTAISTLARTQPPTRLEAQLIDKIIVLTHRGARGAFLRGLVLLSRPVM